LHKRTLQQRISALVNVLEVVVRWEGQQAQRWSVRTWWQWVYHDRKVEELYAERSIAAQCGFYLRRWAKHRQRRMQKRSITTHVRQYHCGRLLRRAFMRWQSSHLRLGYVAESAFYWAAGLATRRAQSILHLWQQCVMQTVTRRQAFDQVVKMRQRSVLWQWVNGLEHRVRASYTMERTLLSHQFTFFSEWRQWVFSKLVQRRRDGIALEAVRNSRKRRWIDQWCAAGRWHRLNCVAESWDKKVQSNRSLSKVFLSWLEVAERIQRAAKTVGRLGAMRAFYHFRSWRDLARIHRVRPQFLTAQSFRAWRLARQRSVECHESYQRTAESVVVSALRAGLRQLRLNREWRKRRQRCESDVAHGYKRREGRKSLVHWKQWAIDRRQKRSARESKRDQRDMN